MTNKKTTKRALLSSVLVMLLCLTMLIGTTFAWFTDSVTSGVNTIQAGTLDIVLEYQDADGKWQDAEGKTLNFKTADNRTTDILWEPGCTYELPIIRVRNNGNLALKYDIVINGVTGNAKLLEAIEFTANGNAITTFSGHLDTASAVSEEIVIKGHMKEDAGNEYQGLTLEGIGITVYATQYTYENDSYYNQYDKVGAISGGRIEDTGSRWQISADFAATGVKTLAVNVVDTNGNIITTVTPETFVIPENGELGDPTDGSQRSWKTICAAVTGNSSSWQNTAFIPTMDAVPATMELVVNGEVVDVSTVTHGIDLWDEAIAAYYAEGVKALVNNTDATAKTVKIKTAAQMFAFADSVNNGKNSYAGYTVTLENDIDLANAPWTPIGQTGATEFKGVFDGQGNTIKNLYVDSSAKTDGHYSSGLFGWIESHGQDITIKNVNVDGATVIGHHNVAVIVGYMEGDSVVENCNVTNATLKNTHANTNACGDKTGVIAGYVAGEVTVKGCTATDCTVAGGRDAGQLIGASYVVPVDCSATNVVVSVTTGCTDEDAGKYIANDLVGRKLGSK